MRKGNKTKSQQNTVTKTHNHLRIALLGLLAGALPAFGQVAPPSQDFFDDFSFNQGSSGSPETINLFTSPDVATFTGGWAGVAGVPAFYHSGTQAWMLEPGNSGDITFETAADNVSFFLATSDGTGSLEVFDSADNSLFSQTTGFETNISGAGAVFESFDATTLGAVGGIDRIELSSPAGVTMAIDDFGVTPVPEPAQFAFLTGVLGACLVILRRKTS